MEYYPHDYQKRAIKFVIDNPKSSLLLQPGLGKTSISLSAVEYLINSLEVSKVLIVAPVRVASMTWSDEAKKWSHLSSLKVSRLIGSPAQRIKAINTKADIYTISTGNLAWLVHYAIKTWKKWPYDFLIIDESSMFRNPSSMRFKALKKVAPLSSRVTILTGTFVPNGLLGAFGQMYLLDQGKRLGRTFTEYKDRYFKPGQRQGHVIFSWSLKEGADQQIYDAISDISLSMETKDYLDLPPRIDQFEMLELENKERYDEFKKTEVLQLSDDYELTPVSAAAMYSKLVQFSNGCVYKDDGTYEVVDNTKLLALCDDVVELNGEPVLIGYLFRSDYERIIKEIPHAVKLDSDATIARWNKGEIAVAVAQYQSVSHGINLQFGGYNMRLFGLPWDLETLIQFIARMDRQGITRPVVCKYYLGKGTIEELIKERLEGKAKTQDSLMAALKKELSL
ncbi:SNF2-related protein [Mucilaginibacter sp.]|jgi:SNF2 family DNA or RNA helicase|uniref:SNF2-related protein n=1 Tax=Mucilaginibacter sp. TaxID=1882438 RepID=UPI0035632FBF